MHYYNLQSDHIAEMHARIKELEEVNLTQEVQMAALMDEIDECREREYRLTWVTVAFAAVAMLAILVACWKDGGW